MKSPSVEMRERDGETEIVLRLDWSEFKPLVAETGLVARPAGPGDTARSPDFSAVRWQGVLYTFTPKQRAVVAALWRAWQDGLDYLGGAELLELAESDQTRVRDLFRGHPAWGTMIVQGMLTGGPLGTYRLSP